MDERYFETVATENKGPHQALEEFFDGVCATEEHGLEFLKHHYPYIDDDFLSGVVEKKEIEEVETDCPGCGLEASGNEEVLEEFGLRKVSDSCVYIQSYCGDCR